MKLTGSILEANILHLCAEIVCACDWPNYAPLQLDYSQISIDTIVLYIGMSPCQYMRHAYFERENSRHKLAFKNIASLTKKEIRYQGKQNTA